MQFQSSHKSEVIVFFCNIYIYIEKLHRKRKIIKSGQWQRPSACMDASNKSEASKVAGRSRGACAPWWPLWYRAMAPMHACMRYMQRTQLQVGKTSKIRLKKYCLCFNEIDIPMHHARKSFGVMTWNMNCVWLQLYVENSASAYGIDRLP